MPEENCWWKTARKKRYSSIASGETVEGRGGTPVAPRRKKKKHLSRKRSPEGGKRTPTRWSLAKIKKGVLLQKKTVSGKIKLADGRNPERRTIPEGHFSEGPETPAEQKEQGMAVPSRKGDSGSGKKEVKKKLGARECPKRN